MNKACLIGRLTRNPELRYTQTQKAVATFTLAINRPVASDGQKVADFISIVVWGKQAENVNKYIKQGDQLAVEGRIQTRTFDDQNGQKRYVTEVIAESVQFLEKKKEQTQQEPFQNQTNCQVFNQAMNENRNPFEEFGEQIQMGNPDLPF